MEGGERRMCVVCDSSVCPLCQVPPDYVPYRLFALFVRFPQTMFLIVCLPSLSGSPRLCSLPVPLCQTMFLIVCLPSLSGSPRPPDYVPYRLFALFVRFPQTLFLIVCLPSLSGSPRLCSLGPGGQRLGCLRPLLCLISVAVVPSTAHSVNAILITMQNARCSAV